MKTIIEDLDLYTYRKGWPKWACFIVPFIYVTTWPVLCYRYQRWVDKQVKIPVLKQFLAFFGFIWKFLVVIATSVTISERAEIGKGLFIAHLGNIVVGHSTVIGDYCSLHQGVTFGGSWSDGEWGSPKVGNNLYVSAGAVIAGKILVGDNVAIGANAVVIKNVSSNVSVGGVPAKVISDKGSDGMIHYRAKH